ncbi:MAG: glycosyltransferase family 9 protein [Akkermansiaceae bacterium]|nr:glycosyltransferase family 9 protein [Akkermansiaceae bacterium]
MTRRAIVNFARVGDLVLATPMLRHLARSGPLHLVCRSWGHPLLNHEPWLAGVHGVRNPNRDWLASRMLGNELHSVSAELARCGVQELLVFARERSTIMNALKRHLPGVRVVEIPMATKGMHKVDAVNGQLTAAGFELDDYDAVPMLTVLDAQRATAEAKVAALGKRVLAVQAGSSLTHRWLRRRPNHKGLSATQWADLIGVLLQRGAVDGVVLLGSAPEGREARAIQRAMPPDLRSNVIDWTGCIGLGELPSVLAACTATVSVDTGPAHIAGAVGCPLMVVFGPSDPRIYAPRGSGRIEVVLGQAPCQFCLGTKSMRACRSNVCLTRLPTATFLAAWDRLLS